MIDATAPQAGATATKETEPKLLRLPRVPTPLVVAVLGIVLGSWLLPAFTRQWDDRQKAGEVKAAIVAQIASASGRALLEVHQATTRPGPAPSSRPGDPVGGAGVVGREHGDPRKAARVLRPECG